MDSAQILVLSMMRSGTTQLLLLLSLLGFATQVHFPITDAGALSGPKLDAGELHRLCTSLFLHADPLHLATSCLFGHARLVPSAAAVYGSVQCLLLFLGSGAGGHLASYRLEAFLRQDRGGGAFVAAIRRNSQWLWRTSHRTVPLMGASAGLFGIDGALLAYSLRNGLLSRAAFSLALRRLCLTIAIFSLRPALIALASGGRPASVGENGVSLDRADHLAHAFGWLIGLLAGLLLAPSTRRAAIHLRDKLFDEMSERVATQCGTTSGVAEHAMLRYLRRIPKAHRVEELQSWKVHGLIRPNPSSSLTASSVLFFSFRCPLLPS